MQQVRRNKYNNNAISVIDVFYPTELHVSASQHVQRVLASHGRLDGGRTARHSRLVTGKPLHDVTIRIRSYHGRILADGPDGYMAFGISRQATFSSMAGADAVVAYMRGGVGYAEDHHLTAYAQV